MEERVLSKDRVKALLSVYDDIPAMQDSGVLSSKVSDVKHNVIRVAIPYGLVGALATAGTVHVGLGFLWRKAPNFNQYRPYLTTIVGMLAYDRAVYGRETRMMISLALLADAGPDGEQVRKTYAKHVSPDDLLLEKARLAAEAIAEEEKEGLVQRTPMEKAMALITSAIKEEMGEGEHRESETVKRSDRDFSPEDYFASAKRGKVGDADDEGKSEGGGEEDDVFASVHGRDAHQFGKERMWEGRDGDRERFGREKFGDERDRDGERFGGEKFGDERDRDGERFAWEKFGDERDRDGERFGMERMTGDEFSAPPPEAKGDVDPWAIVAEKDPNAVLSQADEEALRRRRRSRGRN